MIAYSVVRVHRSRTGSAYFHIAHARLAAHHSVDALSGDGLQPGSDHALVDRRG